MSNQLKYITAHTDLGLINPVPLRLKKKKKKEKIQIIGLLSFIINVSYPNITDTDISGKKIAKVVSHQNHLTKQWYSKNKFLHRAISIYFKKNVTIYAYFFTAYI